MRLVFAAAYRGSDAQEQRGQLPRRQAGGRGRRRHGRPQRRRGGQRHHHRGAGRPWPAGAVERTRPTLQRPQAGEFLRANWRIRRWRPATQAVRHGTDPGRPARGRHLVHVANVKHDSAATCSARASLPGHGRPLAGPGAGQQRLSPDAERYPQRSVITRALGIDPEVEFDLFTWLRSATGCCARTGLSDVVEPAQIRARSTCRSPAPSRRPRLVTVANDQGGPDITVMIVVDAVDDATSRPRRPAAACSRPGRGRPPGPCRWWATPSWTRRPPAGSGAPRPGSQGPVAGHHHRLQPRVLIAGIVVFVRRLRCC